GVLHLLRKNAGTEHIPFVFLTAKTERSDFRKGMEMGADDYITKPFHLDELQLRINNMLTLQLKQKEFLQSQVLNKKPIGELPKVDNDFLSEFYKIVEDNIDDSQMGVDFISSALSMSKSSLNRKLKSILNISPNDLIKHYRLQKAISLLKDGNDIASTAYKVGFTSPSYFTKCFKEQFELTPTEFLESI
ncbi:MAG: helix-turn-helix domain-containing protein, partial [Ferruginibacter sp.]